MKRRNGPWIITGSTPKYTNPWINVTEDEVVRPDGKKGIFGKVIMKNGVSILPLDDQGNVYLTQEFRYALKEQSIEVVSGGIDDGETPLIAAKRELKEELGIEAKEWVDLGVLNPFTSVIHSPAQLFLARSLQFSKTNREGTEVITVIKIPFQEAVDMVMKSRITHGQSSVLILKAKEYLGY